MSTAELKADIINQIQEIKDNFRLQELLQWLKFQNDKAIYLTNDDEKIAITEAQKEIADGKVLSNSEVQNEINQWLNK